MRFSWDDAKQQADRRKHHLSFEEVLSLFDPGVDYLEVFDSAHSIAEDRFIAIPPTRRGIVVVAWADVGDRAARIISARFATTREVRMFRARTRGYR